ncbi:MAG TPA: TetR/AcrR family transcriptional regulator [Prolixibacteraceae bacterium]|jgi:AcrR family transcriptional regulator
MSDTREYIIDQAYSLFLSRSYEAVSISEISKAIGLTKGALYHHFRNKEELFMAVIDKNVKIDKLDFDPENITLLNYIEVCQKKAQEIVGHTYSADPAYIPHNLLALFIDAFRHYPGFAEKKESLIQSEIAKNKKVLDLAIARGEIRNDINTEVMAEIFFTINTGVARSLIHTNMNQKLAIQQLKEQLEQLYKLLVKT